MFDSVRFSDTLAKLSSSDVYSDDVLYLALSHFSRL